MDKQREDFEKWYKEHETLYHKALVRFDAEFDAYDNDYIQSRFFVWQQAQKVAVREGFVLMPKEPTPEIVAAFWNNWLVECPNAQTVYFAYKAMIEAGEIK